MADELLLWSHETIMDANCLNSFIKKKLLSVKLLPFLGLRREELKVISMA